MVSFDQARYISSIVSKDMAELVEVFTATSYEEDSSTTGVDDDDESTITGGGDILQQLLDELSLSLDPTKESESGSTTSGDAEEETSEEETSRQEEETSDETLEETSEEEEPSSESDETTDAVKVEKKIQEDADVLQEPDDDDVTQATQATQSQMDLKKAFSNATRISSEKPEPEVFGPPQLRETIVQPVKKQETASTSSYLPSILNLWRCTNEKDLANVDDATTSDEEESGEMALEQRVSALLATSLSNYSLDESNDASAQGQSLSSLRMLSKAHQGRLSKTLSMPIDCPNDKWDTGLRAVRSHDIDIPRQTLADEQKGATSESSDDEQVEGVVTTTSTISYHETSGGVDDAKVGGVVEDTCMKGMEESVIKTFKLRELPTSSIQPTNSVLHSSTSWVKPSTSADDGAAIRQVKSQEYYTRHHSILLPDDDLPTFKICGLAKEEEAEDNTEVPPFTEEVKPAEAEEGGPDASTKLTKVEAVNFVQKRSKMATKSMGRWKKRIKGLTKSNKAETTNNNDHNGTPLVFSAGQQKVKRPKTRSKHNIFRSLAKYVKSRPLGLANIEENPDQETRETEVVIPEEGHHTTQARMEEEDNLDAVKTQAGLIELELKSQPVAKMASRGADTVTKSKDGDESVTNYSECDKPSESESEIAPKGSKITAHDINAPDKTLSCKSGETGEEIEVEIGTELDEGNKMVMSIDINALNKANKETLQDAQAKDVIEDIEAQSLQSPRSPHSDHKSGSKENQHGFQMKAILSDFKKMTKGKPTTTSKKKSENALSNSNIKANPDISEPLSRDKTEQEIEDLQGIKSWAENENQKGSRFSSLLASPSSRSSSKQGKFDSLEKQRTWTGTITKSLMSSAVQKGKFEPKHQSKVETNGTYAASPPLSPVSMTSLTEERDDVPAAPPTQQTVAERTPSTTAVSPCTPSAVTSQHTPTFAASPRRFLSRMLSKSSLMEEGSRAPAPEELEHNLTSQDQGCPQSPQSMPVLSNESVDTLLDLQRWRSVEQKIDASLKKAEALASHYGEDLAVLLQPSASYSSYASSAASSAASSYASEGLSEAESNQDDWGNVGRKIDDSLSKIELLGYRLGLDKQNKTDRKSVV